MALGLPTCSTCGTSLRDIPFLSFDASVLPHRDLLTSNDQPLREDIQSIRGRIGEHALKASRLDRLLDDIEKAREFVISRREEHARLAKAYKGVLSPIRKLPAELLEEIFLLCARSCSNTLSPKNPPWVFGKVCRRWRSVALSAPQLWSIIPRLTTGTASNNNFYLRLLSTSLRLSRTIPLHLDLSIHSLDANPVFPVLDVISPHIHRCESLEIFTDANCLYLIDQAFRGIKCPLRGLTIRLLGSTEAYADYYSLSTFQLSSNIRDLLIDAPHGPCYKSRATGNGPAAHSWLQVTWSNLTSFVGIHLRMQYVTDLLRNARSLIKCSFIELTPLGTSHFTAVEHISLRSLSLSVEERPGFSVDLLDYLTLPSLAKLSIPLAAGFTAGSLTSFFERSSCSLSTLTFTGVATDDISPLLASLSKAPLTNLNLEFIGGTFDPAHLKPLIGQSSEGKLPFLPHLQHITANCSYSASSGSFQSISQLIESRLYLGGSKALETVTLRCPTFWQARRVFNELDGWSENPPQQGQVTYAKVDDWLRVFGNIPEWSAPLGDEEETSLHEVILEIEACDLVDVPPMFIHRSMICDDLSLITKLPDDHFEEGDQYQLRRRASVILESWKDVLAKYLGRPGWSMRKCDLSGYEHAVSYSTAGRDYHTFRP